MNFTEVHRMNLASDNGIHAILALALVAEHFGALLLH
jgi:hypothetical protein